VALTDDPAVLGPRQSLVQALVVRLRVILQAIDHFDAEITVVAKRLPGPCPVRGIARCRLDPRASVTRRLRRTT
jgi:hypothetical protein